ncbi:MAG: redoxin domain-containing protein [Chitinophaga sp.]|uniref:peroxiredoxin family protein n=1 Tax=Chitinophaga sp. TaxID=1869181 RepID=UPI0025BFE77F|nr:redoxin domain-containing protein [Chitinophaga sp.]MBV8254052.1 redoxin domain-containing protein [Chitinophaga sp.]
MLWIIAGLLITTCVRGQSATITGKVAGGKTGQHVSLTYWVQPGISPGITMDAVLAKDSFYFSLPPWTGDPLFFYVDAGGGFYGIISRGDHIHLDFTGDTIYFAGRGSAANRALYLGRIAGKGRQDMRVADQLEYDRKAIQAVDQVLQSYKDSMPGQLYSVLRADLLGMIGSRMIGAYWEQEPDVQESIYNRHIGPALPQLPLDETSALSGHFLDYLLDKAQLDYHRAMHRQCTHGAVYEWIKNHYSGVLQEKLLAHQLLLAFATGGQQEELEQCAEDYLKMVRSESCKEAVAIPFSKMRRGIRRGLPAPGFSLPDHKGNMISLSQFAGKVVLLHFCADDDNLVTTLNEISKCFDKKDVVFLHIGMTPLPIHENGIQLYPGNQLPAIQRAYNVSACPTLIVIARNGRVFAVKPPNPSNDQGTELTNVIYEALQQ